MGVAGCLTSRRRVHREECAGPAPLHGGPDRWTDRSRRRRRSTQWVARAVLREAPLGLPVVAGRAATVRLVVAPCIVAPLVPGRDIVSI